MEHGNTWKVEPELEPKPELKQDPERFGLKNDARASYAGSIRRVDFGNRPSMLVAKAALNLQMRAIEYKRTQERAKMLYKEIQVTPKLKRVPFQVSFTQLLDENDCDAYRRALLHAGGSKCNATDGCKMCQGNGVDFAHRFCELDVHDRCSWSSRNLALKNITELAALRAKLPRMTIESRVRFPLRMIPLRQYTPNLSWLKNMHLFPADKFELTQSSHEPVKVYLGSDAFDGSTTFSSMQEIQELRDMLPWDADDILDWEHSGQQPADNRQDAEKRPQFLTLTCSPLNAVTLLEEQKEQLGIPLMAKFYSFCYPAAKDIEGVEMTAAARREGPEELWWEDRRSEDPFVKWLTTGGFIYYSHSYDIVGINAISYEPACQDRPELLDSGDLKHPGDIPNTSTLWFSGRDAITTSQSAGSSTYLQPAVVAALDDLDRWWPVTCSGHRKLGFHSFAWITPCEFIGGVIFTQNGGFAFRDDKDAEYSKSVFFPNQEKDSERWRPSAYDTPMYIPSVSGVPELASPGEHHKFHHAQAHFADGSHSALGLQDLVGGKIIPADENEAVRAIVREVKDAVEQAKHPVACEMDISNVEYVAEQNARSSNQCPWDQNPWSVAWDKDQRGELDHDGWSLDDFMLGTRCSSFAKFSKHAELLEKEATQLQESDQPRAQMLRTQAQREWPAVKAKLKKAEVVALRLYTTSTFRLINQPLRECSEALARNTAMHYGASLTKQQSGTNQQDRIPLPITTQCIDNALKKLRACHMAGHKKFKEVYLWRGLKNLSVNSTFMLKGGTEFACMSATENVKVMAAYARSEEPLIFRIKVESPMEMGADISWLSVYPDEKEVLYPPMTYLKPMFRQRIRGKAKGEVVSIKATFSS